MIIERSQLASARLLLLFVFVFPFSGCDSLAPNEEDAVVQMYRAMKLDGSDEWAAEVRIRLGCEPCEEFREVNVAGDPTVYLFTRDSPTMIFASDIISTRVLPVVDDHGERFKLILTLSDSGKKRLTGFLSPDRPAGTVNEIGGELAGVNPRSIVYDQYFAGKFSTLEGAEAAALSIGLPTRTVRPVSPQRRDR